MYYLIRFAIRFQKYSALRLSRRYSVESKNYLIGQFKIENGAS